MAPGLGVRFPLQDTWGGLVRLNPHGPVEVCFWEEGGGPGTIAGAAGFLHLDCRGAHLGFPSLVLTATNASFS